MIHTDDKCPVCDSTTTRVDVPRQHLRVCTLQSCRQLFQILPDGSKSPLDSMLERNALGDDRVRSAITIPHITTIKNFVDIYEQAERTRGLTMNQAFGELRTIAAQLENRIDSALAVFTGLDLVSDQAADGLAALREAREIVSVLAPRTRGLRPDGGGGAES